MRNFTLVAPVALTVLKKLVHKYAMGSAAQVVCMLLMPVAAFSQTATPVAVTGYTADVIANGGTVASSVTADVDGNGYYFINDAFTGFTPAYSLPALGTMIAASSSSVTFNAPDGTTNNSLRLVGANATGTLKLVTSQTAGTIYLMCAAGNGPVTNTIIVYYEDGTWQQFGSQAIPDWYNTGTTTTYVKAGIGRVTATSISVDGGSNTPRMQYITLSINSINYGLKIDSIGFTNASGTGTASIAHIMGVSIAPPCVTPAAQPTLLNLDSTISTITGSFTAASPAADGYLVVRYPAGSTPTAPVDKTTYTAGQTLGAGIVVQSGTATTFTVTALTANTGYDFYIYSIASDCVSGPVYNPTTPLTGSIATKGCNTFTGTFSVGPTGDYPSITTALQALNDGISGPVTFELQSAYVSTVEKFPIVLSYSGCYSATNNVTIRPAAGANGLKIIDTATGGPAFYFNGANYFTIDGRPGGVGSTIAATAAGAYNSVNLNIADTTTGGLAIRLDSGASYNTIKYCDIQGKNNTSAEKPNTKAGVIYFGNGGANGNDNNTIDHCNIHSTGTGADKPSICVYSLGFDNSANTVAAYVPQFNDSNTISNSNIYDFFSSSRSAGIELNIGNEGWNITGNSLFQTADITITEFSRPIWIVTAKTGNGGIGNGFNIVNNYIGGKAPNCGGGAYTLASGSTGYLQPMEFEVKDPAAGAVASSIQGNVITNISVTSTYTGNPFDGLYFTNGSGGLNIGNITGNVIGSVTGVNGATDGGITIATTGSTATNTGINFGNAYTANVANNKIGNILMTGAANNFGGILIGASVTGTISNNLVTNIAATNTTAATAAKFINGIQANTGSPVLTITGNTVQNISCAYASTSSNTQVVGINVGVTGSNVSGGITGNIVRNLSNASQTTGTTTSSAIIGISMNSTNAAGFTVSNNIIDSLILTGNATSAAITAIGLYVNGGTSVTGTVSKNFIHTIDVSAANTSAITTGIQFNAGTATFSNNMVRLGIKPDGTPNTTALTINGIYSNSASATNYYHNSIYVGGSGVGSTAANTFAFKRNATSGTYDVRDNIFSNTRANTTTGGKHYAVFLTTATTGFTSNYNLYQYSGVGGVFAYNGTTDIAQYNSSGAATTGWLATELNSVTGSPNFINPTGAVPAVNLHINTAGTSAAEGNGTAIAAVTDDIDGETRSGLTPADIGADAGNFTAAATCTTPDAPANLVLTPAAMARMNGSFTAPATGASGYIVVRYPAGATPVAPANGLTYTVGNTLGTGAIVMIGNTTSFIDSGLVANTTYDYYVYSYNDGCLGEPQYSTTVTGSQTTGNCAGSAGLITVGPTGTYPTLTAALTAMNSGISGAVTVELQSDYTPAYVTANETFPIVIGSNSCFSTTNTVTIRPAANASGLVISAPATTVGPTFDFVGGNYVTIDGRPGGVGSSISVTAAGSTNTVNLNILNSDSTTGAAIRFNNGASNNTVKYCDLQGQNTEASGIGGVVYFGSNGANGNDNNKIDYCNIHSVTASKWPTFGVYSQGATNNGLNTNFNDGDTITNSNIYDFFHSTKNSIGVYVVQGASGWVITGNSFFQTANRASAGVYHRGIWVYTRTSAGSVGNGFTITDNYIGGTAPLAGGTAYTLSFNNTFDGIRMETIDGSTPNASLIQDNVITNLAITSTSTSAPTFEGIMLTNTQGAVNIIGNTIGATTGNDAINLAAATSTSAVSAGIIASPGFVSSIVNIRNNNVGSVTTTKNGNTFNCFYSNNLGNMILDGNLFGSLTTANSVRAANSGTTSMSVRGIHIATPTTTGSASFYSITNNTIANLSNYSTSTTSGGSQVAGIMVASSTMISASAIGNNTIRNLYNAAPNTAGSTTCAVLGIGWGSTYAMPVTVSGNTVHSLVSGAATAGVYMEGIFVSGSSSITSYNISKNKVHSYNLTSTSNTSANMRGIELNGGGGNVNNNMVRMGIRPDGTALTNPVRMDAFLLGGSALATAYVYNNSAYVGGTGVGTNANFTAAFHKETTIATTDVRNNLFINNRSNATTGGNHFAVNLNTVPAAITFGNNIYGYGGTGGAFASTTNNNTVGTAAYSSAWIASGDNNSQVVDPLFIDPTGAATTVDLHITTAAFSPANGAALPMAAVTDDIDGEVRDATTPDVGADEFTQANGIDMQAVSLVQPTSAKGCYTNNETVTVKVRNNSSVAIDFAVNPVTVTATVSGNATATLSTVLNTGTLAGGTTQDVTLPGAIDMSANGTYIFDAKTTVASDIKLSNDSMVTDTRTKVALTAGTISVTGNNYCLTGNPVLSTTGANGYDTIQWQLGTDFGTGYTGIPNAYSTPYTDTINAISYYRLMAVCGTDTLYTSEAEVIVKTPEILSATPATRCDAGKLTLQAVGSAGATLTWYSDSTGANAMATGGSMVTANLSVTDTFYVTAASDGCESARIPVIATVNQSVSITAQPAGQFVCPGSNVTFTVTATGTGITYQWQKDGTNITGATDSFYTVTSATAADNGDYKVVITGTCGAVTSSVATLALASTNQWVGTVSDDWNTAANWCGGVPTATTDVTIIPGTPYSPVVSGAGYVHTLTINRGATVTLASNGTLNMYGNFVNNKGAFAGSAGTVAFVGAAAQTIAGLTAGTVIVNGAGVTLNGNMTVVTNLTLTSGHITLGTYNLYLSHSATGTMASHIISNSTGGVILPDLTTTVSVPVGFSATSLNPVSVGNGQGLTYTVRVADGTIANMADNDKAINRTFTVTTTTVPASAVTITFQYADAEANANCNPAGVMDAGVYNGITYAVANGNDGLTPTGTSAARLVTLSTTQLGSYVLANKGAIHVTVDEFKVQLLPTVINGTSAILRISTPRTMRMEWMVLDMAGKMVKKFSTEAGPGVNDINVQLPGLANGVYQLRAASEDGKLPTIRFMIQH